MALNIISTRLPTGDTPVCGVPLDPYVLCKKDNNTTATADELPEEGSSTGRFRLRFRWFRSVVQRSGAVCWIHPDKEACLQCILCLRCRVDSRKSFHCSTACLKQHWSYHKELHEQKKQNGQLENGYSQDLNKTSGHPSTGGEAWIEVGRDRQYTPSTDDVGSILKVDVVALDTASAFPEAGKAFTVSTSRVKPAPQPPKRNLVELKPTLPTGPTRFTALTYNLLADLYATMTAGQHSHCQPWMLAWGYRKQNILKELLSYKADILCLQEVQSNHFLDFLAPKLQEHGYSAIYKKKTTEIYAGNSYAIDGCATFFLKEKFSLVKKYEVEFNKAALSLSDALSSDQRQGALNRLLKDNVALIAVLEALDTTEKSPSPSRRQLICVANTHIHANPELSDVKLWQVHTLLKGLEKIAASADIPMLVAGDFNSVPGSAAHSLLINNSVDAHHRELSNDPLGILRPPAKLRHHLPLASAYAAVAESRDLDPSAQRLRQRLDPVHREPKFTSISKDFRGTLDYILYTSDSLVPTAALDLPEDADVSSADGPGMPNEQWSSDHIALLAEFAYRQLPDSGRSDRGSPSH